MPLVQRLYVPLRKIGPEFLLMVGFRERDGAADAGRAPCQLLQRLEMADSRLVAEEHHRRAGGGRVMRGSDTGIIQGISCLQASRPSAAGPVMGSMDDQGAGMRL